MRSILSFTVSVIFLALVSVVAVGCSSGKEVKLEMNREVILTTPTITSITLSPEGRIDTGSGPMALTVRMEGDENLQATFDVPGLVETQAMKEDSPGVYIGSFDVRQGLSGHVPVTGHLAHKPSGAKKEARVPGGLEIFVGPPVSDATGGMTGSAAASEGACSDGVVALFNSDLADLTVRFEFNQFAIPQAEQERLKQAVETFRMHPECDLVLHGHADEVGYEGYNLHLSMRRALAVGELLESLGLPSDRLLRRWHGEAQPVEPGADNPSRAKNRRVEIQAAPHQ